MAAVVLLMALAAADAAMGAPNPSIRVFDIEARVAVDASGTVTRVTAPSRLPPAIADVLDAEIRRLRFLPPKVAGRPVSVETNLRMQACGPRGGDARTLSMRYRAHGPSLAFPRPQQMTEKARQAAGVNGGAAIYEVRVDVSPDGKATMASMQLRPESTLRDMDFLLRRPVKNWVEGAHFLPELVDGRPQGAQVDTGIEFRVTQAMNQAEMGRWRAEVLDEQQRERREAATCEVAHALDTPHSAAEAPLADMLPSVLQLQLEE